MNRSELVPLGWQLLRQADNLCRLYPDRLLMWSAVVSDPPASNALGNALGDPLADDLRAALVRLRDEMLLVQSSRAPELDALRKEMSHAARLCNRTESATGGEARCRCLRCHSLRAT
ncbi:hypothetical protein [Gemmata sp.]|uniref:hypothetical protein n=1 Tax=Gemmata sp. TaxID=1914242 RepID=UPI003F6E6024